MNMYDDWYSVACTNCGEDRKTCGCISVGLQDEPMFTLKYVSDLKEELATAYTAGYNKAIADAVGVTGNTEPDSPSVAKFRYKVAQAISKLKKG